MNKFLYSFSIASLLFSLGFIFVVIFWAVYPYKIIQFLDPKFPVLNKTIRQGGILVYKTRYCKYIDIPAFVTRRYENGISYTTPSTITNRQTGCHSVNIQAIVPDELPSGDYKAVMTYQYDPNPIKKVTIIKETEKFTVLPKISTPSANNTL